MRLPDLRNLGICLRILVLVNLMALIAAILHANSLGEAIRALAEISITLQPTLLLSLLLLYAINPVLQKLSYVWGAAIVIASELLLTSVTHYLGLGLFGPESMPPLRYPPTGTSLTSCRVTAS